MLELKGVSIVRGVDCKKAVYVSVHTCMYLWDMGKYPWL